MSDLPGHATHPLGDAGTRRRFIAGHAWLTVPATALCIAAGYFLSPVPSGVESATGRVLVALRWLPVAMLPYVASCGVIMSGRFFEGSHDPLRGGESERLKIHCRVMQNTLEQLVWFTVSLLAVASLVSAEQARIVPVACVAFAVARALYWWGYLRKGTLGRAPGVQTTAIINGLLLVAALGMLVR
jgi:uncharacterized membrane protein YecN with MAPEG domain